MLPEKILQSAADFVRERFAHDSSGHDWQHISRVRQMAVKLAAEEGADLYVTELAALMHDVDDWKLTPGASAEHADKTPETRRFLQSIAVPQPVIDQVCDIITRLSFKGAGVATPMHSLEGQCVQDADRLDAIGAIGIARAFAYGGAKGRQMIDDTVEPEMHGSFESYKKNKGPTVNHFYEKLLLLKDRINTESAKRIANERHEFMQLFLQQLSAECRGIH
ncbi:metal dependent phosphohydrolase [Pirellula staleyi DSM 6068]|uniref:Metal dependent phosphohydrolase n=1 Tax=Pirellula staleyi (strain ATCC 27377 / DSM 6068 / ICPB 4128) TaxID=530564 RepID=D2R5L4_PIRSD|nr:HD domain-containing protein [Pirellula staleyi]ADB17196.1 metal dependent phosphohydrolase [Pirellula staleyi DSM 6068]